jgi:hypothetical protein
MTYPDGGTKSIEQTLLSAHFAAVKVAFFFFVTDLFGTQAQKPGYDFRMRYPGVTQLQNANPEKHRITAFFRLQKPKRYVLPNVQKNSFLHTFFGI